MVKVVSQADPVNTGWEYTLDGMRPSLGTMQTFIYRGKFNVFNPPPRVFSSQELEGNQTWTGERLKHSNPSSGSKLDQPLVQRSTGIYSDISRWNNIHH